MSTDVLVANSDAPPQQDTLPNEVPVLKAMVAELLAALKKSQHQCLGMQQQIDLLLRRLFGAKAERFDPNQPWLIPEMANAAEPATSEASADEAVDDSATKAKPKRKGHGRKPLPDDLPRQRIEHILPEAQRLCPCCGEVCAKFGEAINEQLDFRPASLFVRQHVRFKYACSKCHDHVTMAPAPVAVIDKGLPGPGLLAQLTACKYADHLPLHRLERILARHGVKLSRSTMCDWMAHVAGMFRPVVDLMATLVRQSQVVHTDATKMPYLDADVAGKSLSGQMWDFVGDRDHAFNVFAFCRDHSATTLDAFLTDKEHAYRGYLHADALNIYDHLFVGGTIVELGCWAHCRRNFYNAKDSDPARATLMLARIRRLYEVEAKAKAMIAQDELPAVEGDALRHQLRQQTSLAEVTAIRQWLLDEEPKVLPKSIIGHGFLAIDNNIAELTLRHIAIGRKNWMFAGSAAGAETAAILFSVTSTCHRNNVDAFAYVRDLLERLAHDPKPTPEVLRGWLPDRWRPPPPSPPDGS
jgi:transposase